MKTLSIDIETFSSVNLAKTGVYRYAEAPDFKILLFGYSVDGGEVRVIDIAGGETISKDILDALTDGGVDKWAFNANFERVCLSRFLGKYLSPASWHCSMIWCATLGLPLSLEGAGTILGLEKQKLTEGKELVRYFCMPCKPTESNVQRTRNLPYHAPDKWRAFKAYNVRDVETEMSLQAKLARFPVPESVWKEYCLDQEINDRGVALDITLAHEAIAMDERSRLELTAAMKKLTELENPNSVQQIKRWLAENGLETDTLGKKNVAELLKTAPPELAEVLALRQRLAKSSVRKYQTMENAVCSDGRARGMFQFYGANRTGRWCLTGEHEVLTDSGWVRLDEWNGGRIACWNPHGEAVSFQKANRLVFPYQGVMYLYEDKRISQVSTPDHRMFVKKRYKGEWTTDTIENMAKYHPSIPFTGYRLTNAGLEHSKLRVMVMIQADGHYCEDGTIRLNFAKLRKAERCKSLLRAAGIQYSQKEYDESSKKRMVFLIHSRSVPLWLREFKDKTFGGWLFDESPDVFFDELVYWDGYRSAENSIQYVTCNKQNADIVQAFAHISGRAALIRTKVRSDEHPNWHDAYYVDIWLTPVNCHEIRTTPKLSAFCGNVYCAETSTGYFLVRRSGRVWITGNSGRLIQMQNLVRNSMPDLEQARALVRSGNFDALEMLYEDVPDTLSQLIRTAFIPSAGKKFIVSDFSAIEARVIAWLAGERWRQKVFAEGGDIYCLSASSMFHVPVEKHGVNAHLRQKGKIAELACIAEGQLVLTNHGLTPIEKVTLNDLLWDGDDWVRHDGVVFRGEREVIEYDGLIATPDHLVWVEGKSSPIQLGLAARGGAPLMQTGDGLRALRLGGNHQPRKTLEQENKSLLCHDKVHRMRPSPMAGPRKPCQRKVSRLSAMRESKMRSVPMLWSKRNSFSLPNGQRGWAVLNQLVWAAKTSVGNRPDRQQFGLCRRKPSVCDACPEQAPDDINGDSSSEQTEKLAHHSRSARLYDIRNAGEHHRFTVSGRLVHNCGYGGSVGALKAMGALDMGLTEDELPVLVDAWRQANPSIVKLWWDVDRAAMDSVRHRQLTVTHGLVFAYQSAVLFITLPSGRRLAYVKPRIGENKFGGSCITYEGVGATKKWERLDTYGPKLVENIVQATARDLLSHAMQSLQDFSIVMHIHDEVVIEAEPQVSVTAVCEQMSAAPVWAKGLLLNADGYECCFYKKD